MTAVVVTSALELAHLRQALVDYIAPRGRDAVPQALVDLADRLDALSRRTSPKVAVSVAEPHEASHGGLVTYTEAANRIRMSKRTVSRLVADGRLDTQGRRITSTSIDAYVRGER